MWWKAIIQWITGDLVGQLTKAYEVKKKADTDEKKLVADATIKMIEAQIEARAQSAEIRKQTAGFWEMRLLTFIVAGCFAFHLVLVTIDTCFMLGWGIPKFPSPMDEWEGTILLSFFGAQAVTSSIASIASAIRGRK